MPIRIAIAAVLLLTPQFVRAEDDQVPKALSYEMKTLEGKPVKLSEYKGSVILVVNVASECGLTPQYEGLQALYEAHKGDGLAILGFPCNQFGQQEPGSAQEIREFCDSNYKVTFPLFAKIDVNGDKSCDLYKYLTSLNTQPKGPGKISWNFEKFVLNRKGEVIARFAPQTKPDDPELMATLKKALSAK